MADLPTPALAPPSETGEGKPDLRIQARLGEEVTATGFQPVPDVLLFHQADLGLRSEDLNVLLQITAHWFFPERMPFPRPTTIARRMGVSPRTVQRSLSRLREMQLIAKTTTDEKEAYDLRPLMQRLKGFAIRRLAARAKTHQVDGVAQLEEPPPF
jgi:DNA-binding transcriptional ArsR family regulator